MLATWQQVITAAPASFLVGVFVGWLVSQRYIVVRRAEPHNRREDDDSDDES